MITDSHMHTKPFSSDSRQTAEELITAARDMGFERIAITEHYDMDYPHKEEKFIFNFDEYMADFPGRREFSGSIGGPDLLMGIEFGWQPHLSSRIDEKARALPFDFILLSSHLFRGKDIYYCKELESMSREDRNKEYIGALARMCREVNEYDSVAHFDYINRYLDDTSSAVFYNDCPEEFDDLFDALISKDKALEINTKSIDKQISKGSSLIMPDPEIIRRYMAMGGKLFTIGSDAHSPQGLGIHFDDTALYLKSLGVADIYYYEGRQPKPDPEYHKL